MANLEQSGSQDPHAWSEKLTFSLIVAFYLRKTENITKKPLTQLLLWVKVLFFAKNADFLQKKYWYHIIQEVLVLKSIFSETTYV